MLLTSAVRTEDLEYLELLLRAGHNPNVAFHGVPPLVAAGQDANPEIIDLLLRNGASPRIFDRFGNTVFHVLCESTAPSERVVAGLQRMIDLGHDPQEPGMYGFTPLHLAARIANPDVLRFLLEKGANANARTDAGETPLHRLMIESPRQLEALQVLLNAGADPTATSLHGFSPLENARRIYRSARAGTGWRRTPQDAATYAKYAQEAIERMERAMPAKPARRNETGIVTSG